MPDLTCTTITSVDLAHYGVSRAKDWESVDCGTIVNTYQVNSIQNETDSQWCLTKCHCGFLIIMKIACTR